MAAIITDVLPADKRALGFTLSYLGINVGGSIGALLAGFLFNNFLKTLFVADALTSVAAIALIMLNTKETLGANGGVPVEREMKDDGNTVLVLLKRPALSLFILICAIFFMAFSQCSFSLPIMLDYTFAAAGPRCFGIIMSSNCIMVILLTLYIGKTVKNWNALDAVSLSGLLFAVGFGTIYFIHSMLFFIVSAFVWTTGEIVFFTSYGVYIANNSPQNYRARINGVTSVTWAIGAIIGTSMMGKYMERFGVRSVWPLVFMVTMFGAIVIFVLKRNTEASVSNTKANPLALLEEQGKRMIDL
jgi:predicted MFS family arabinose efflux permease